MTVHVASRQVTLPWFGLPPITPRRSYLLFGGALTVLAVLSLLPGLLGPSLDAAVFSVVGQRVASGELPYLDVFDHKPPGQYLLIAAGQALGSIGAWNVAWILSVAAVALTGVLVADTLRQLGWRRSAWVVGGLGAVLVASFPLALGGGMTETTAVLPAVAAVRLVAVGRPSTLRHLASGVLAGAAAAISLQAAPVLPAVLVIATMRAAPGSTWPRRAVDAGWILAGTGVVTAGLLLMLGTAGATAAAFDAMVRYNRAFMSVASLDDPAMGEALHTLLVLGPLAVLAVAGAPSALASQRTRAAAAGAITWIAASALFIALQGRMELHYAAMLVVPLALLAPAGLRWRITRFDRLLVSGLTAGLLLVAVPLSGILIGTETAMALHVRGAQAERSGAVASWIDANVPQDAQIFVWGNAPDIYLRSDRAPASDYVYLLPLTTPGWVSTNVVDGILNEWTENPPAVLVDAGSTAPGAPGLPPLLLDRPVSADDGRTADMLEPLRDFAREHYRLAWVVEGWPVYVLR